VKVHFDFFTSDGVWVGKAVADVPRTIAARKAEPFSVTFSESIAADDAVARATGEKY
jgi:hypothetical protein